MSLEFLGIVLDTERSELKISDKRLQEIVQLLSEWLLKDMVSKRQLLSIIGKLAFCAKVVHDGHRFLRHLINLSKELGTFITQSGCQIKQDMTCYGGIIVFRPTMGLLCSLKNGPFLTPS